MLHEPPPQLKEFSWIWAKWIFGLWEKIKELPYMRKSGSATLVGGTVTVSTTIVSATSVITCSRQATGGTLGHLSIGTITAGTSFVINSSSGTDTSVIYWQIIEP